MWFEEHFLYKKEVYIPKTKQEVLWEENISYKQDYDNGSGMILVLVCKVTKGKNCFLDDKSTEHIDNFYERIG